MSLRLWWGSRPRPKYEPRQECASIDYEQLLEPELARAARLGAPICVNKND
ncbi:MAG: hypothetical protein WBP81_05045 [Solirubrobacteraceae bacterium]